jgi:hypothetical protein
MNAARKVEIVFTNGQTRTVEAVDVNAHPSAPVIVFALADGSEVHANLEHILTMDFSSIALVRNQLIVPN